MAGAWEHCCDKRWGEHGFVLLNRFLLFKYRVLSPLKTHTRIFPPLDAVFPPPRHCGRFKAPAPFFLGAYGSAQDRRRNHRPARTEGGGCVCAMDRTHSPWDLSHEDKSQVSTERGPGDVLSIQGGGGARLRTASGDASPNGGPPV